YFHPDLTVVCGKPLYENGEGLEQLTNPSVVFEILSDSTKDRDREIKLHCYKTIPSLLHYVLISQTPPLVEVYSRTKENRWKHYSVQELTETLNLENVGITLSLSKIYEQIEFPDTA
ncbi:MAG: Uma2 family endonuclease, partial [Chthonomonadaceae bacterium]|nr:Uma2 family endonuclease [Chthonomonadaceae bacterium]